MFVPQMVHTMDRLSKERGICMKAKYVVAGMAVSSLLGATAALAIAGDLNANGMKKISKRVERGAKQMGIQL